MGRRKGGKKKEIRDPPSFKAAFFTGTFIFGLIFVPLFVSGAALLPLSQKIDSITDFHVGIYVGAIMGLVISMVLGFLFARRAILKD